MSEQQEYYTFTKDVKTLIQYVQEQAIDHSVVEAANRLNWAIKKGLRDYGIPVTPIKESKYPFEEEKSSTLKTVEPMKNLGNYGNLLLKTEML